MIQGRRLAIVSTYDDLCGIAGYTRAIEEQLSPHLDVEVFDLDQFLMKSASKRVQVLAEKSVLSIAARLREFDSVNIQLEHGTLGRTQEQIIRRFRILADAAPSLSVTFHTVIGSDSFPWEQVWKSIKTGNLIAAGGAIGGYRRTFALGTGVYRHLRRLQEKKPVSVIVHTRRDMRMMKFVHRLNNVHHHPLTYISEKLASVFRSASSRENFPIIADIPADSKLIGTFGFLSSYKGFETAIKALKYLPPDHHLLIFGGIHPQGIKKGVAIDPYIEELFSEANIGRGAFAPAKGKTPPNVTINLDASDVSLLSRHPGDLSGRVHFMGVLGDAEFMGAMAVCDAVVLPYLEVGQSSSGPISIALDMGCRILASRTAGFMQFARYHPGRIEFFDIGNYVELAGRLASTPQVRDLLPTAYNVETNIALYLMANGFPQPSDSLIHKVGAIA